MAAVTGILPKITLYTNHECPFSHRLLITIKELGLSHEEHVLDLSKPREPWYLKINPKGVVPTLNYNGHILTESTIASQFLADAYPSHLLPPTDSVDNALKRARISFFVDRWNKTELFWLKAVTQDSEEEKERLAKQLVAVVEKEVEPLLEDAAPFFGGSSKLTFAEAITAPFVIRYYAESKDGLLPKLVSDGFNKLPNFSRWAAEVMKHESVTYVWNEKLSVEESRGHVALMKKAQVKA